MRAGLRRAVVALGVTLSIAGGGWSAAAAAQEGAVEFEQPAQPLGDALAALGARTGLLIGIDADQLRGLQAPALSGRHTPEAALRALLAGSGFEAVRGADGSYTLRRLPPSGDATMLPAVKVETDTERSATTEGSASYLGGPSTTATGLSLSPRETPQSVSVITQARIEDQSLATVADALRHTTGVSLKAVDRGRNSLTVRGFDVNNFQLDGVPTVTGNIGIETGSTVFYDRIEVVRGATGLLSGAGDPSAAVNLVRKHADSGVFTGSASLELGSWDQRTVTVDLSTPLNRSGSVRARVIGSRGEQDAFIDLEHTKSTALYAVVDADLGPSTRLSVGASDEHKQRDGVYWGGLPFWYSDGSRAQWDRSKTTATDWNVWDTREQTVFAALEHAFENRWTVRANLGHYRQEESSNLLWVTGEPDRESGLGMEAYPYLYYTRPRQNQVNALLSGPFELLGREHELSAGLMYSRAHGGWDNGGVPLSPVEPMGDFNQWDGSYPEPVWGEPEVGSRGTLTQSAVYSALRLHLAEPFHLVAGGRLSRWKQAEDAAVWTPEAYEVSHSGVFTPYLGALYDIGEHLTAYASYTDIFKPQTQRDRYGSYLDPLEGKSYEAGLKGEFLDGSLNASAAVFRVDQENLAVLDGGLQVPGTTEMAYRAAQGVESEGYELEVTGEPVRGWSFSLGWTHYSAKDADGNDVVEVHPRELLRLFAKYSLPGTWSAVSVGGGIDWQGDAPARRENPVTGVEERIGQDAYALVNLMASYQISRPLLAQINIDNLFDETYYENSWGTFTYGEPRRVLVSFDYRF